MNLWMPQLCIQLMQCWNKQELDTQPVHTFGSLDPTVEMGTTGFINPSQSWDAYKEFKDFIVYFYF